MISFPVILSIDIQNYALYPGADSQGGLRQDLSAPLSVVVGANGLGKSTMLAIIFRSLTGPSDIPGASTSRELGSARLEVTRLNATERREFAHRVSDGAITATASITFSLGAVSFSVTRALSDLALVNWSIDGIAQPQEEASYQEAVSSHCGVWSFADWILLLRYVTFFRDDRQVLFWDRSAQKQLLRSLFLPPSDAGDWVERERNVLRLDSEYRNTRVVLNKESRRIANRVNPGTVAYEDLREQLIALLNEEEMETEQFEDRLSDLRQLEEERANKQLELLRAQRDYDSSTRAYERAKVASLAASFPGPAESALFVWSQLLVADQCLVCGTIVPNVRRKIESRIAAHHCAICDSEVNSPHEESAVDLASERATRTSDQVFEDRHLLAELEDSLHELTTAVGASTETIAEFEMGRAVRQSRISTLQAQLPDDEREHLEARSLIAGMQSSLEAMGLELKSAADDFDAFLESQLRSILSRADDIKSSFEKYAQLFLLGDGELTWSPREESLGQSSHRVTMPAYELQLARNDGGPSSNRSGPDDVSESQKEFIDLAFRMALVEVAGGSEGATILIDTPESSLDAVFSSRAAEVLADFVTSNTVGKLVVASNLTDGQLIPLLVKRVRAHGQKASFIDLLTIARPTPAMLQLGGQYREAFDRLLELTDDD